jgi:hypothetical protein
MVLLEQLCREEFENEQTIGQALLSDMLREECPKTCDTRMPCSLQSCTLFIFESIWKSTSLCLGPFG